MLIFIISIFILVALGGIYLISFILRNKNTPKGIAIIHGCGAILGAVLLIIYCIFYKNAPILSLIIFIIAACAGIILLHKDLSNTISPKKLAIFHGVIAILALTSLIIFAYSS